MSGIDAMVTVTALIGFYLVMGVAIGMLVQQATSYGNLAIITAALWPIMAPVLCVITVAKALRPKPAHVPKARARKRHLKIIK